MRVTPTSNVAPSRVPILIVDDDRASAKLLFVLLRDEGYDVHVARSAEEALAKLVALRPRAIVLDMVLPLMSGHLLAQRLKADPATRDIPIIAVTAFNGPVAERAAYDAGCDSYLSKPIDPLSFVGVVRRQLGDKA